MKSVIAHIKNTPMIDRVPLYLDYRASSKSASLTEESREHFKLAARKVWASMDHALYDIMIRLQILQGVAEKGLGLANLRWWQNPRKGLLEAVDFMGDMGIHKLWLSKKNTQLVSVILRQIHKKSEGYRNRYTMYIDTEDIMNQLVMGVNQSSMSEPKAIEFGRKLWKPILSGKMEPKHAGKTLAKFGAQLIRDYVRALDREMGSNVAPGADGSEIDLLDQADEDVFGDRDYDDRILDFLDTNPVSLDIFVEEYMSRFTSNEKELAEKFLQERLLKSKGKWRHGEKGGWADEFGLSMRGLNHRLKKIHEVLKKMNQNENFKDRLHEVRLAALRQRRRQR